MKIKRVPVIAWGAIMLTPTSSSPHTFVQLVLSHSLYVNISLLIFLTSQDLL